MSARTDEEDELLESLAALDPLSALNPDEVNLLTAKRRRFLVSLIQTGSVPQAKKIQKVTKGEWTRWNEDETFVRILRQVQSPPALAYGLYQVIATEAAMRLLEMLRHPSVKHRQWAIDRATDIAKMLYGSADKGGSNIHVDYMQVQQVLANAELPESQKKLLEKGPFETIEGQAREVVEEPVEQPTEVVFSEPTGTSDQRYADSETES